MPVIWDTINLTQNKDNSKLLMHRNCPICDEDTTKSLLFLENLQFYSDSTFPKQADIHVKQCQKCGCIYLNPLYSNDGFKILFAEAGKSYGSTAIRPTEQIQWLQSYNLFQDNFRVLDVGCGTGAFLASLPGNVQKVGVDIDLPSIKCARNTFPHIEFICSDFDELHYTGEINLITMLMTLEHLPNPKKTLTRLYQIAIETTKLVIEVPIIENGLTNDINGFFSALHLTHFSRNSLKNVLELSGWEILEWLEHKDYNGCRVLAQKSATPKMTVSQSSHEILNAHRYLSHWYHSLANVEQKILALKCRYCVIWGAGMHLEFLYQTTSLFSKDIQFIIVDSDLNKHNKCWRGIHIYSPQTIKELTINGEMLFIISSYGNQNIIKDTMEREYGIDQTNIVELYDTVNVC